MSGNPNITISLYEKRELERKAKAGWKCFFMMRDDYCDMNESYGTLLHQHREMIKRFKEGKKDVDLTHLINCFVELYDKVKENTECPVCFDLLTKTNIEVPSCGHLICKTCKEEVMKKDKKCPCCRKAYYS